MTFCVENRPCCRFYESVEMLENRWNPDFKLWHMLQAGYEETAVEMKAKLGRQIVSNLPAQFRADNRGRFVAVTFTGKKLAVCDTLEALNKEIAEKKIKENYYIERIGYDIITQI